MAKLQWRPDDSRRIPCQVAMIGGFEATITKGGAMTIGVQVFVGTFAGRVVAISATFDECEKEIQKAAFHEILRAGAEIGEIRS